MSRPRSPRPIAAHRTPVARAVAAEVEGLESRTLLSAVITARGTLVVTGTGADDTLIIQRDLKRASKILVTENGTGTKLDGSTIKRIELYGAGGADALTLNDANGVISARGATLFGGAGDDTMAGSLGGATFFGGDDNDLIKGSSRNDTIDGEAGNDTVLGGRGQDFVTGGLGDDSLLGSFGDDQLYGDQGNDTLAGEDGNDTLGGDNEDNIWFTGDANPADFGGNDSLDGGNGDDWLVGGRQSITVNDNNGLDTLTGGAGNDILDSRGWANSGNPFDVITDRQAGDIVPMENFLGPATQQQIDAGEDAYAVHEHSDLIVHITDANGVVHDAFIQGGLGDFSDPNDVAHTFPRLHTHTTEEGKIHYHDLVAGTVTLGEFFRTWGVTLSKNNIGRYVATGNHKLTVTVKHGTNGTVHTIDDPYNYVLHGENQFGDGDIVTITYT